MFGRARFGLTRSVRIDKSEPPPAGTWAERVFCEKGGRRAEKCPERAHLSCAVRERASHELQESDKKGKAGFLLIRFPRSFCSDRTTRLNLTSNIKGGNVISKKSLALIIIVAMASVLCFSHFAGAHSGDEDAMGCHICETNCEQWGLEEGEYHCDDTEADSGNLITSKLWIKAVINTDEKGPVKAVWKRGGQDATAAGDTVIWGYFHASPDDVTWGSEENPDLFVKIWFDRSGRVDVNFFHVSVPEIEVYSDYPYDGVPDEHGTTTMTTRYIRQYYLDGQSNMEENSEDGKPLEDAAYYPEGNPPGYSATDRLRIGTLINTVENGPIEAIWHKGGESDTADGHRVLWGHFYASPDDVNWGSKNNPDLFVKVWFDASGRVDVNYFHVSVPDIEVYSDLPDRESYNEKGTTIMENRYIRHEYHQYEVVKLETDYGDIMMWVYDQTPLHKANFMRLVKTGFYDNTIFHRVIDDFMIQGGAYRSGTWEGDNPDLINAEIDSQFTHVYGAVGAARTSDNVNPERKSSGSQFYIVENSNGTPHLNMNYTVFGQVIDGMNVVEDIADVETNESDRPLQDVYLREASTVMLTAEELLENYNVNVLVQ
ncbi:MAG: hypothetical protein DRI57_18205 [Deltaproteobacteria bacterium]|nr:MAG: hypothetical protein DRI57_18205 [Deltaproteobacteria bacterium]